MPVKHSYELLDDVFKQITDARIAYAKPQIRIWMHPYDVRTLVVETKLLLDEGADLKVRSKVSKLLGYELYSASDTSPGEPIVETYRRKYELPLS